MLPWAAIGGAIGGLIILIALLACGFFCYRKRNNRAHDLENTTADISEPNDMKDDIVLLPSTAVDVTEQTELGHAAKLEEADLTPQIAATGENGLTEASLQEPVIVAYDQPLARSVPPTPRFQPAYATYVATVTPHPTQLSPEIAILEPYQQPHQQIAPRSFKLAMNGDEAIGGDLKEKRQARKEYKQALVSGKMVYLLEQAAPDGKCLKDMAKNTRKLTIIDSIPCLIRQHQARVRTPVSDSLRLTGRRQSNRY